MKTSPPVPAAAGRALVYAVECEGGWTYLVTFNDNQPDLMDSDAVYAAQADAIRAGCKAAELEAHLLVR